MDDEEFTSEEIDALREISDYPKPEEKSNPILFLKEVVKTRDNIKTANLDKDEIGILRIPVRTNLEIGLYCKEMGMKGFAGYFEKEAQIALGTSLSREGFLDKLAVTQKKESEIKTRRNILQNKGWFKKKQSPEMQMM